VLHLLSLLFFIVVCQLDVKDGFGITPLLAAVYESHVEMVKYLVGAGASAQVKGPDGQGPIEAAETDEIKAILKSTHLLSLLEAVVWLTHPTRR